MSMHTYRSLHVSAPPISCILVPIGEGHDAPALHRSIDKLADVFVPIHKHANTLEFSQSGSQIKIMDCARLDQIYTESGKYV